MQCLACGAEMQLREVVLADIPTMPGFERHTFRCSACPQVARRLVICRAKMPVVDPLVPSAVSEAPTTNLQTGQQAAGVLPNAVEKLHSTQAALEDQDVTDWLPTVEKLSMALKERAVAARASAWAKTVENLRSRQMALKERAPTGDGHDPSARSPRSTSGAYEECGFSGSVTPYFSRSAFASSARPTASSASAVTRALSLVQAWSSGIT